METMQELIPFAKEMMTQKPNGKLAKLYLVGSVLAFFGVVIGLVETVCSPFTARVWPRKEEEEEEEAAAAAPAVAQRAAKIQAQKQRELIWEKAKLQPQAVGGRSLTNRLHAS
ncbi:G0/G1 switch protein 2 [Ornithorhynchus anatinus]|uniref:G0/G1 switch protein 2 n=1 Tax=Ornithorhynchus anatinus TaxID=9258 RepID=UPI000155BA24|nr:G0/G1 switch protein 2 [Ornithorhynchus anatinus]